MDRRTFSIRGVFPLLCLFLVALGGCMGYRVGAQTLFSPDIATVYVPVFKSDSLRAGMAERLTEAVIKRIEERSNFKVVHRPTADSTLIGHIQMEKQSIILSGDIGDPRQKEQHMEVKVEWIDRRQKQLRQFDAIPWSDNTATIQANSIMTPEFGHSQTTTEQQTIDKIADQIVGMMELPW